MSDNLSRAAEVDGRGIAGVELGCLQVCGGEHDGGHGAVSVDDVRRAEPLGFEVGAGEEVPHSVVEPDAEGPDVVEVGGGEVDSAIEFFEG